MYIALIKNFDGLTYYGNIPEIFGAPESSYERFELTENERDFLIRDFVNPVNDVCGTLLDLGDIDFFDYKACKKLINWLNKHIDKVKDEDNLRVYQALRVYCEQAIRLNTGIVVEL